jgi:hypothetical protein
MNETEKQVWDLVHDWCGGQYHHIPDMNRRYLMDRILELLADTKQKLNKHNVSGCYTRQDMIAAYDAGVWNPSDQKAEEWLNQAYNCR